MGCSTNNNKCIPMQSDIICKLFIDWSCPNLYSYDKHTNSCTPDKPNSVCALIESTLTCPFGCSYNNFFKKCISSLIRIIFVAREEN